MKVLQLVKTAEGATWALRQVQALIARGLDVTVAMPPGRLVAHYERAGANVIRFQSDFPVKNPLAIPRHLERFRLMVKDVAPDVIHSHFVGTTLTMRMALRGRTSPPRVFQVPGPLHLEHALYRAAEIGTGSAEDVWIGSCRWTCERYRRSGIDPGRVFLSYYGLDPAAFVPAKAGKLRSELGLSMAVRIVGMVAFMYAPKRYLGQRRGLKGHEDLIDALALLRRRREDIVGVFVGGAWADAHGYERRVRRYAQRRLGDGAVFLGTRADVPELYADFDLAVHPSHSENVGGALESMLLGVPTLASDVGGFPDLIDHGETGWLVRPRSANSLAATIERALDDPRRWEIAQRGRARTSDVMDLNKNVDEIVRVYERVVRERVAREPARNVASECASQQQVTPKRSAGAVPLSKRALDIAIAVPVALCAIPVVLLVSVAAWMTIGKPVLFRQMRPGRGARPFVLLKFRSLRNADGPEASALSDDERMTRFGRFLRRTSLDELPQLWNVIRGEMSLVGPRPLRMEYLSRYTPEQARRHEVLPGITGWAQVNGRNALSWEEKFALDVWYVDNWSVSLDLRILVATFIKVLTRSGVSRSGDANVEEFRGTSPRPED
jgi:lipopolysaccharide/colanic/teichoic acid biosynthesis glycosyltransferase